MNAALVPVIHHHVEPVVLGDDCIFRGRVFCDAVTQFRDQLKVQTVGPVKALDVFHRHVGPGDLFHENDGNLTDPIRVEKDDPVVFPARVQKVCPGVRNVFHIYQIYGHTQSPLSRYCH